MDPEDIDPRTSRVESSLLYRAARSGFIVAGVLLLSVGSGDMLAGRLRIRDYRAIIRQMPPPEPRDPTALFPKASEAQEQLAVAQAKLAFNQLLFLAGQLLAAAGVVLLAIGAFQLRQRTLRIAPWKSFVRFWSRAA
jgi:hypothetical protein